jgi:hypothetical protein
MIQNSVKVRVENVIKCSTYSKVKVKLPRNRPYGPEGGRGIAVLFLDLSARSGWVVNTTPWHNTYNAVII